MVLISSVAWCASAARALAGKVLSSPSWSSSPSTGVQRPNGLNGVSTEPMSDAREWLGPEDGNGGQQVAAALPPGLTRLSMPKDTRTSSSLGGDEELSSSPMGWADAQEQQPDDGFVDAVETFMPEEDESTPSPSTAGGKNSGPEAGGRRGGVDGEEDGVQPKAGPLLTDSGPAVAITVSNGIAGSRGGGHHHHHRSHQRPPHHPPPLMPRSHHQHNHYQHHHQHSRPPPSQQQCYQQQAQQQQQQQGGHYHPKVLRKPMHPSDFSQAQHYQLLLQQQQQQVMQQSQQVMQQNQSLRVQVQRNDDRPRGLGSSPGKRRPKGALPAHHHHHYHHHQTVVNGGSGGPQALPHARSLDIRVGRILAADAHPESASLYVEQIDVGEDEPRTIVSRLGKFLSIDDLPGRTVIVLCNLKARKMLGVRTRGMILCASDSSYETVELLAPPEGSVPGERVYFGDDWDQPRPEPAGRVDKRKIWQMVRPHLRVGRDRVATCQGSAMNTSAGAVCAPSLTDAEISGLVWRVTDPESYRPPSCGNGGGHAVSDEMMMASGEMEPAGCSPYADEPEQHHERAENLHQSQNRNRGRNRMFYHQQQQMQQMAGRQWFYQHQHQHQHQHHQQMLHQGPPHVLNVINM